MSTNAQLRSLPGVDRLLEDPRLCELPVYYPLWQARRFAAPCTLVRPLP